MQTASNRLPTDFNSDGKSAFNVVVVYEDFETGKAAKKTYDYLVGNLGEDCAFSQQMWKFDVLRIPKLAAIAVLDACAADIIIVATHGGQLPMNVRSWLDAWTARGTRAIALVGLCDGEPAAAHVTYQLLREAAQCARIQFFAHPDFWPAEEVPIVEKPLPEHAPMVRSPRTQRTLYALSGVVLQDGRHFAAPRWGLNE